MKVLFVIDIDNTVSDGKWRFDKCGVEPSRRDKEVYSNWVDRVNAGMTEDKPVPGMIELTWALSATNDIIYLTSREERHYQDTREWLFEHGFPTEDLVMRPNNNYDETEVFKAKMIALARAKLGAKEVIVIDDDPSGRLADVCRSRGWTLLKAVV